MPARHPVGIGHAIIIEALFEVLCLADVEHLVADVLHQIDARFAGCLPEKPPAQQLIERLWVGEQERLAHTTDCLIEIATQRQPNRHVLHQG